ncbi:4-coumarate--CoA ligase-like 5 [Asimina triloba]
MARVNTSIDPRSGYCSSTSTFYSKRHPLSLPSAEFLDVATFIASRPHSHANHAFIDAPTGLRLTFSHLWRAVHSVATWLSSRIGLLKGDVVLILSANSIYFPIAVLSALRIGAIVTTANVLNTPREIARQIADSNPKLAFAAPPFASKLADANLPIVLLPGGRTEASAPIGRLRIVASIEEMMAAEPSRDPLDRRVRQGDPATILYSSGTTGASKGVVATHRNLIAATEASARRLRLQGGEHTFLATIPMFHVYGLTLAVLSAPASGLTAVVLPKFEIDVMASAIATYRVTYVPLVPPILAAMEREAARLRAAHDLGSLRTVLTGGAALGRETMEEFRREYPTVVILQGYAMTETNGGGTCMETEEESGRCGTAGLLTAGMEAKIVDPESGEALGVNRTGELWLRGPSVMKGYFGNPEATRSALGSDGWLQTGDLCCFDEDGYMVVVDRLKELIKYKGYQVAPAELESLLIAHDEIMDAAVIPFPDKEAGQLPMAFVVRKTGSNLSDSMVMSYVQKQVAPYKRIRRVEFVDVIPKNPSGKILRKDLVKLATSRL